MTDDIKAARKDLERAIKWGVIGSPPSWDTMRLALLALDALVREQREDAEDEADAAAALAEPGPSIPYEQVRRELGLDDGERDKFQSCLRLTPAQIAAIDDGCYHQLDIFRDAKGVRWMLDGKDVP